MSTALQLQFFMVQAVNYSMIIVKNKVQKPTKSQIENAYHGINFFIVNVFQHTSRKTSR